MLVDCLGKMATYTKLPSIAFMSLKWYEKYFSKPGLTITIPCKHSLMLMLHHAVTEA